MTTREGMVSFSWIGNDFMEELEVELGLKRLLEFRLIEFGRGHFKLKGYHGQRCSVRKYKLLGD
jgi:hypothetical protein